MSSSTPAGLDIVVVAGGWSISRYNMIELSSRLDRSIVIGINDAALLLPECDLAVTMDRLWIEGRYPQVEPLFEHEEIYVRKGVAKNFQLPAGVNQFQHDGSVRTMTKERGCLNGSNSGTCGINLAFQLALNINIYKVFLLGFDMQDGPEGQKHWYPPYPWRPQGATTPGTFKVWSGEFREINQQFSKEGIRLINVNHRSTIAALVKIKFQDFLEI